MALSEELPIYRDTYKLLLEIYKVTNKFSREYKYSLGQDMKRDALILFRNIYRANVNLRKRAFLEEFLSDYEILKLEIRLCRDLNIISIKKLAELSAVMDKIGKQATAWKNSTPKEEMWQQGDGRAGIRQYQIVICKGLPERAIFLN